MTDAQPSPLIFYVLIVATFAMLAAVIWFVLSLNFVAILAALPFAAVVAFTGKKVCE